MRAMVTGVAGFIGSHVAEALLERGWEVAGVDNLLTGRRENVPEGVVFSEWDIADDWHAGDCDLVVHCAASYAHPDKWARDVRTNVLGTINATLAAKAVGARLFYFQTSLPAISSYAISKLAGQQYIEVSGVDHVVFRLANVYGPRNLSGPVPAFFRKLDAGEVCTVVETQRDMVFVDDLVDGVMAAVARPRVRGVVDMCSGVDHWILELYLRVGLELGSDSSANLGPPAADDVAKMALDPARALAELGWVASTALADGIREAVAWYREHGVERTFTHLRVAS